MFVAPNCPHRRAWLEPEFITFAVRVATRCRDVVEDFLIGKPKRHSDQLCCLPEAARRARELKSHRRHVGDIFKGNASRFERNCYFTGARETVLKCNSHLASTRRGAEHWYETDSVGFKIVPGNSRQILWCQRWASRQPNKGRNWSDEANGTQPTHPPRKFDITGAWFDCPTQKGRHRPSDRDYQTELSHRWTRESAAQPILEGPLHFFNKAYSMLSTSACRDAVMMFSLTPTVPQSRLPSVDWISTRVFAAVPATPSRMRTL